MKLCIRAHDLGVRGTEDILDRLAHILVDGGGGWWFDLLVVLG